MTAGIPLDPATLTLVWVAACSVGMGATVLMALAAWWWK